MFILTPSSCHNQETLFEFECDDVLGEGLLDQSTDSREEFLEQEVVVLIVVQPADTGHMLTCNRGIFAEVDTPDPGR